MYLKKTNIIAFGKAKNSAYYPVSEELQKRIKNIKIIELNHISGLNNIEEIKVKEEKTIEKNLLENSYKIFLDSGGKQYDSYQFTDKIFSKTENKNIEFIIGGAYGFSKNILKKANLILSFGKITLPHMLARIILLEQIYRAETISNNHPYHK